MENTFQVVFYYMVSDERWMYFEASTVTRLTCNQIFNCNNVAVILFCIENYLKRLLENSFTDKKNTDNYITSFLKSLATRATVSFVNAAKVLAIVK